MVTLVITLLGSLAVLVITSRYAIRLLTNVTTALGISEFTVAFIILAVATSVPELSLSILSALDNAGELVLATALGSNVINMTLIIGTAAIVSLGISTSGLKLGRDLLFGGVTTTMPILFLINGVISRLEGGILITAFCIYMLLLYRDQQAFSTKRTPRHILKGAGSLLLAILLLGVIVYAADRTVGSSVELARILGLPTFLIGIFLLALGTSLPEFTTTVQSALLRKPTMALGNILGSNVTDSALIIGIASVIRPIHVPINPSLLTTVLFILLSLILLGYFATTRKKISMSEGLVLLLVFIMFIITTLLVAPAS
ncbi:MAG: sodium:calcium antiporter [Candidatus Andersenbacteria bacterium]